MSKASKHYELPRGVPEEVGMSDDGLNQISDVIGQFIAAGKIPGAVVGVARRGKVIFLEAQGVADEDTRAPMQHNSLFQMASSTKPVTGVAAMMMIEEGLFKPGDTVESYIPEFKGIQVAVLEEPADEDISPEYVLEEAPPHRLIDAHRPITIHDLLTHTSGLASYGLGMAVSNRDWQDDSLATWIPKLAAGPLDFQPGTRWAYSPLAGLDVVARIIEIVSGTPFNDFVQARIFDPLDMKDTHWILPEEKTPRLVVFRGDKGAFRGDKGGFRATSRYFSGSVGLISTVRDYLHFEQMLLNAGELFGTRLLSPESIALMSGNKVGTLYREKGDTEGLGFGYTVAIDLNVEKAQSPRSAGAFGWAGAFGTMSWTEPERELTAVIMVQQATEDLHIEIARAISDANLD
jgi:CubicO group peptidase (beta-lactamase class C family)